MNFELRQTAAKIIAKYQVTNGGPVILYQTENEYTNFQSPYTEDFVYEKHLTDLIVSYGLNLSFRVDMTEQANSAPLVSQCMLVSV